MLKVCSFQRQDTAVGFYRCIQPMRFLVREKICQETRILPWTGDLDLKVQKLQWQDRLYMEMARDSTAFITDVVWHDEDFLKLLNLRKWSGAKWVVDIDDNILAVTRDNPAYQGVKDVLPKIQRTFQFADGITVSVPILKKIYSPLNRNIFINPNGIDFSWWDTFHKKRHGGLRVGWRGASGHRYDLELAVPAMRQITRQYPGTKFVVFHQFDPKFDFPYEWQPFVPFRGREDPKDPHEFEKGTSYPETLSRLGLDIAIVPLADTAYNRCKSNLAYLEFSALKIPTILSPVENQKNMVALYAKTNFDWYEQLSSLIEGYDLRRKLGQDAYDFVRKNFSMHKLIYPLAAWLEKISYRTDIEPENYS
ncbi:MAG: glycosyltransferase family protein [Nitrospiria bacterium]